MRNEYHAMRRTSQKQPILYKVDDDSHFKLKVSSHYYLLNLHFLFVKTAAIAEIGIN